MTQPKDTEKVALPEGEVRLASYRGRAGEVTATLRDEILSGQFRSGQRLPSERDLGSRFSTGRGTIREAIGKLEQFGLVEVQPGGARVRPLTEASVDIIGPLIALSAASGDPVALDLLQQELEVTSTLICLASRHAVRNASDDQLAEVIEQVGMLRVAENAIQQAILMENLGKMLVGLSGHLVLQTLFNSFVARAVFPDGPDEAGPVIGPQALELALGPMQIGLEQREPDRLRSGLEILFEGIRRASEEAFAQSGFRQTDRKRSRK